MPLFPATRDTERENLLEWIDAELVNARSIVHGLTGDQLRACPLPTSELTLGWLILHIGEVAESWTARAAAAPDAPATGRSLPEAFAAALRGGDPAVLGRMVVEIQDAAHLGDEVRVGRRLPRGRGLQILGCGRHAFTP